MLASELTVGLILSSLQIFFFLKVGPIPGYRI